MKRQEMEEEAINCKKDILECVSSNDLGEKELDEI